MADIQSAAAEIRRGKKKKEEERTNHSMKIYMVSLLHRATINHFAAPCARAARTVNGSLLQHIYSKKFSFHSGIT